MLKATVDTIDVVPEAVRELYVEKDGKFHLQVEGLVPAARLNEFRDNNIRLTNEKSELEKKFAGIDLEQVRKDQEQAKKIREKQLIDAGQFDELFEQRVAPMRQANETELKSERDRAATLQSQLDKLVIDGTLRDAAIKAGVMPSAIDDVLLRGKQVFRTVDGKAVAADAENKPMYGTDGEVLSSEGWLSQMQKTAPHWWPPSKGGGAQGSGSGAGGANTITRKAFEALGPSERMAAVHAKTKIVD